VVYYQGREMVTPEGHYLLTDESKNVADLETTAVSHREVVDLFGDARGAQVLMLDVERMALANAEADAAQVPAAFDGARLGVLQSFWTGKNAPANRLLELVQRGWPEADNLDTLARRVVSLLPGQAPQLRVVYYAPEALKQLEFGGKR